MPTVRADDPRPAWTQIADDLRAQIDDGRLGPDTRLPSTRELMDTWDVANATVQRALRALQSDGLIESVPGQGRFVATTSSDQTPAETSEPQTLEEARAML